MKCLNWVLQQKYLHHIAYSYILLMSCPWLPHWPLGRHGTILFSSYSFNQLKNAYNWNVTDLLKLKILQVLWHFQNVQCRDFHNILNVHFFLICKMTLFPYWDLQDIWNLFNLLIHDLYLYFGALFTFLYLLHIWNVSNFPVKEIRIGAPLTFQIYKKLLVKKTHIDISNKFQIFKKS